jgi:hypothetical protein
MTSKDDDAPTAKKAKISVDNNNVNGDVDVALSELATVTKECWELYRSYIDVDEDDDDDDGTTNNPDEILQEICERLRPHMKPFQKSLAAISNVTDMLPILASVAYLNLGSTAIGRYTSTCPTDVDHSEADLRIAQEYINKSLQWYPRNAMAWSAGANLGRISCDMEEASIVDWYQKAAMYAQETRKETLELLETREYDNANDDNNVKEWMMEMMSLRVTTTTTTLTNQRRSWRSLMAASRHRR